MPTPRLLRLIGVLLLMAVPLGMLLLPIASLGYSINDLTPFWSDELYYWHQAATWRVAGLQAGVYSVSEQAALTPYYAWGVFQPAFQGSLPWVDGLRALVWQNLGLLMLAVGGYVLLLHPRRWHEWLGAAALLLSFLPLWQYLPFSMHETVMMALGLWLAGVWGRLLRGDAPRGLVGLTTALLLIEALFRPQWALYLWPLWVLADRQRTWRRIGLWGIAAALATAAVLALNYATAATYPLDARADYMATHDLSGLGGALAYSVYQVGRLFAGSPLELLQRAQVGALALIALGVACGQLWRKRPSSLAAPALPYEALAHGYALLAPYAVLLAVYRVDGGIDYRQIAPALLLSMGLLLILRRSRVFVMALASMAIGLPWIGAVYHDGTLPNLDGRVAAQYAQWQPRLAEVMAYQPQAERWCNTLSVSMWYVIDFAAEPGLILAVPHGMGISWLYPPTVPTHLQSAYLALTDYDVAQWQGRLRIEPVLELPEGALYRNVDSSCWRE